MADPDHEHGYHGVVQLIDHPPVTHPKAVLIRAGHGLDAGGGPRIAREVVDGPENLR
jgi:hypothetical protein